MNLLWLFSLISFAAVATAKLEEKFSWKQLAFDWASKENEEAAIKSGEYIAENNLPLGLEKWQNKLFITVPRWKSGVASSLNYVDLNSNEKNPKLMPYPSWEANRLPAAEHFENYKPKNNSIVSTFRIQADNCDRLWVLDTGLADILGAAKQVTGNSIVIFDLKTDQLIRRFDIPKDQTKDDSFFANIIVDSDNSECSNSHAYIPDLGAYGVVVYSLRDDESHRVTHNYFHFDPLKGDFNVGGVNFQWTDGVFGMAVGPKKADSSRDVYFHALASTSEFKVSNLVLQNKTHATSPNSYNDFQYLGDRGDNGQSTCEAYDKQTGVIFYTQVNRDAIACWNVNKPYKSPNLVTVASDTQMLIFPNDLKVDPEGNVWVLSDKMPTFLYQKLDPAAVNYRVLMGKSKELIKGTECEK